MASTGGADWERLPVTEASARGIARLAKDAEAGHPVIITRHGRPVAAIVPLGDLADAGPTPVAASATQRWVQAVTGGGRRVPGPPPRA